MGGCLDCQRACCCEDCPAGANCCQVHSECTDHIQDGSKTMYLCSYTTGNDKGKFGGELRMACSVCRRCVMTMSLSCSGGRGAECRENCPASHWLTSSLHTIKAVTSPLPHHLPSTLFLVLFNHRKDHSNHQQTVSNLSQHRQTIQSRAIRQPYWVPSIVLIACFEGRQTRLNYHQEATLLPNNSYIPMPKVMNFQETARLISRDSAASQQLKADRPKRNDQKREVKHVKWDLTVQDNEYKAKPRPKALVPVKMTPTAALVLTAQRPALPTENDISRARTSSKQEDQKFRIPGPHRNFLRRCSPPSHPMTPEPIAESSNAGSSHNMEKISHQGSKVPKGTHLLVPRPRHAKHIRNRNTPLSSEFCSGLPQYERYREDASETGTSTPKLVTRTTSTCDPKYTTRGNILSHEYHLELERDCQRNRQVTKTSRLSKFVADTRIKRNSSSRDEQTTDRRPRAPPAVPEPPLDTWSREPPPALRPARLATPDLPEIEGCFFHDLKDLDRHRSLLVNRSSKNPTSEIFEDKMDEQIHHALAHMQKRLAGRK